MNLASLKKEQKQTLILIVLWTAGALFAVYQFILVPVLQKRGSSTEDLDQLHNNIQKAELAMEDASKMRADYAAATRELQQAMDQYIVPIENPLSWVTEKVYLGARQVGVDIQSVAEISSPSPGWDNLVRADRVFRPYAVRIIVECNYAQMLHLVDTMEQSNPYLCVSGISVAASDQNVTRHSINLTVEWPMWGRRIEIGNAQQKKGESHG